MIKIYTAPMAGVTDYTYRGILRGFSPDLVYTEMVSVNAMEHASAKTLRTVLRIHPGDAVQIFGHDPALIARCAKEIRAMGVRDIDLNCGCPMKKIVNAGNGAALLEKPEVIRAILQEMRDALGADCNISIKIRSAYKGEKKYLAAGKIAEEAKCSHITIHGRTREQMYTGLASWEPVRELKQEISIPVIGNGDLYTAEGVFQKAEESGADGVMLARGILGYPWLIRDIREYYAHGRVTTPVTDADRIGMALFHTRQAQKDNGDRTFVFELRKHLCWYLKGIKNSAFVKNRINQTEDYEEITGILEILKQETKADAGT